MRRSILALTTLLTAMFTLSSAARANEQMDRQAIANRYQVMTKAAVKDTYYDVNEHLANSVLMNSGKMLASNLIKTNPSGDTLGQENNQVPNIQLIAQNVNVDSSYLTSLLAGTWKASAVFERGLRYDIFWTINPDGTSYYLFRFLNGGTSTAPAVWSAYSNTLFGKFTTTMSESSQYGWSLASSIQFINRNYFVQTIDYSFVPGASLDGSKRYYQRVR